MMAFEVMQDAPGRWRVVDAGREVGYVVRRLARSGAVYLAGRDGEPPAEAERFRSFEVAVARLMERSEEVAYYDEYTVIAAPGQSDEVARAIVAERDRVL